MNVIRLREPERTSPLSVTLLCLIGLTVAGGSLLLSVPESNRLVDGALPWHEQSLLRAVVELLCLNYEWPTRNSGSVKIYALGLGAGLAMVALGIAILLRDRPGEEDEGAEAPTEGDEAVPEQEDVARDQKRHIAPLNAAQFLVVLFVLWSFASSRWSAAPDLAVGGSLLITIHFLWAFALGHGLNPTAGKLAARLLVAIAAVTACLAVWYYYGRNPSIRAKFPFGNPQYLAACLIPGIILSVTLIVERAHAGSLRIAPVRSVALIVPALATLGAALWAFRLAGSRGAAVGLAFGLMAMLFFVVRGWLKIVPVLLAIALSVGGWFLLLDQANQHSMTGRDSTIRFRLYTWQFAWTMFLDEPVTGFGQGGFTLHGDGFVSDVILDDPQVFTARVAHAHNEWLEILADLGSVGLVLMLGVLCFTLAAGHAALKSTEDRALRWTLIGLMGALVALAVEQSFGVGLRVSGVPTVYYTLIGLVWAVSGIAGSRDIWRLPRGRRGRGALGVTALAFGLASLVLSQADWSAARRSYDAELAFVEGDIEQAIADASHGTSRLNPQRALTNLYRLAEAHLRAALQLQERALDRERRALSTEPVNMRLAAFAREDFVASDDECVRAAHALKELVQRSPTFLNHGYVDYMINTTRANNTSAMLRLHEAVTGSPPPEDKQHQARQVTEQYSRNAAAAAQRELQRQPFNPLIAMTYASAMRDTTDLGTILEVLARPIRYSRIGSNYARLLMALAERDDFDAHLAELIETVVRRATGTTGGSDDEPAASGWTPELLRLAATVWFMRGDYAKARGALELAVPLYDTFERPAPLAAAGARAELADCRFFHEPREARAAIAAAEQSLEWCPPSEPGRSLRAGVERRMVQYLLAAGREADARALLARLAMPGTSDEAVTTELGSRYRRLCEAMLARRAGHVLRRPVDELYPMMRGWIDRALALHPSDPLAHRIAADLAFHAGEFEAAARHLQRAVDLGLPLPGAMQYLTIARQQAPDAEALDALWQRLSEKAQSQADAPDAKPSSVDLLGPEPDAVGPR